MDLASEKLSASSNASVGTDDNNNNNVIKEFSDVPYSTMVYIRFYFMGMSLMIVTLLGAGGNVINIIVFIKQGLQDASTITFLALSVADFCNLLLLMVTSAGKVIAYFYPDLPLDAISICSVSSIFQRSMFVDISVLITTFISLERCLCVNFPFKFRNFVSRRMTIVIIAAFCVIIVATYTPTFLTHGLSWQWDPFFNKTRLLIYEDRTQTRFLAITFVNVFNAMILTTLSQVVVSASAYFLIRGLRRSARFREKSTSGQGASLNTKDRDLARTVLFLAVIFVVCQAPFIAFIYAQVIEPEFSFGRGYTNLTEVVYSVTFYFHVANASANIFVYLKLSSKYRSAFRQLMGFGGDKSKD